jgi:hypothetical protein
MALDEYALRDAMVDFEQDSGLKLSQRQSQQQ